MWCELDKNDVIYNIKKLEDDYKNDLGLINIENPMLGKQYNRETGQLQDYVPSLDGMTDQQKLAIFIQQIAFLLDRTAQEKNYDSAVSIATYVNSTNQQWKSEADAFVIWRDLVFEYSFNVQSQVESGTMPIPTIEDFINGAPQINWPQ